MQKWQLLGSTGFCSNGRESTGHVSSHPIWATKGIFWVTPRLCFIGTEPREGCIWSWPGSCAGNHQISKRWKKYGGCVCTSLWIGDKELTSLDGLKQPLEQFHMLPLQALSTKLWIFFNMAVYCSMLRQDFNHPLIELLTSKEGKEDNP